MISKKLTLAIFKKEQTSEVAKTLGFDLRKTKCCMCKTRVNSENIGHFVHLNHKPATLCRNPYCFKQWIVIEKQDMFTINPEHPKNCSCFDCSLDPNAVKAREELDASKGVSAP